MWRAPSRTAKEREELVIAVSIRYLHSGTTFVTLTRTTNWRYTIFLSSIYFYVFSFPLLCKIFFISLFLFYTITTSLRMTQPDCQTAGIASVLRVMPRPCHESSRSAIPVVTTVSRQVGVQKRVRCMQGPLIWSWRWGAQVARSRSIAVRSAQPEVSCTWAVAAR